MNDKKKLTEVKKNKSLKSNNILQNPLPINILVIILAAVVIGRVLLTFLPSHKIDIGVLRWEIDYLAKNPLKNFNTDVHFVYGPVYSYFLWISGEIVKAFSLPVSAQDFLIKIWAVFFDIIAACFVYLIGKKYNKEKLGLVLAILYAFNPAIIFNSSVWGQFDGITAALFIAIVYFFNLKKINIAVFIYAIAALTKPQSIALLPLVAILYFKEFPWKKFSDYFKTKDKSHIKSALKISLTKIAIAVFGCLLIYTILVFPVYKETPFYKINEISLFGKDMMNISSGKQVNASSVEEERFSYEKTVDGDLSTAWSSKHTDPQWLYMDLGSPTDITNVDIKWGYEYAKEYSIQISDDASNWTTVFTKTDGKGKNENIAIDSAKARYIKIECLKRPFPYGMFHIEEDSNFIKKAAFRVVDFYYWLVHHYTTSLDDYPYATANGFNIWTIFGKQAITDTVPFIFGISCGTWGYIFLFGIVWLLGSVLLLKKQRSVLALYLSGYFLTFGMFLFTSRIHERYLLPSIIFAMVCVLWDKRMWIPTVILSAACLANQWYVYYIQNKNSNDPWLSPDNQFAHIVAWVTFAVMAASIVYLIWLLRKKSKSDIEVKKVAVRK